MFADELADLKDRYPARLQLVHVLSREPREVELLQRAARRGQAAPAARRRSSTSAGVDHWWLCGPFGMVTEAPRGAAPSSACPTTGSTASCSTSKTRRRRRSGTHEAAGDRAGQRGHDRAGRPVHHVDAARATRRSWTAPSGSGPTCRSPARAASAAPAGPG